MLTSNEVPAMVSRDLLQFNYKARQGLGVGLLLFHPECFMSRLNLVLGKFYSTFGMRTQFSFLSSAKRLKNPDFV